MISQIGQAILKVQEEVIFEFEREIYNNIASTINKHGVIYVDENHYNQFIAMWDNYKQLIELCLLSVDGIDGYNYTLLFMYFFNEIDLYVIPYYCSPTIDMFIPEYIIEKHFDEISTSLLRIKEYKPRLVKEFLAGFENKSDVIKNLARMVLV